MTIQFSDDVMVEKFIGLCTDVAEMKKDIKSFGRTQELAEKHEKVYTVGKYAALPVLSALHLSLRSLLAKLGY